MHATDITASEHQIRPRDHRELAVREHPARNRAVIMPPRSRVIDQVLVLQHPLIRRGTHGHRTDIGEDGTGLL
jgi:hypothetical protein